MHIMWTLPDHFPTAREVADIAAAEGVGLYTLEAAGACEIGPSRYPRTLVLGYASLTPEAISKGIARVARALGRAGVHATPRRVGRTPRSTQRTTRAPPEGTTQLLRSGIVRC
jgi:GntR family transcriptional regulator/MocR family aminotransferase